MVKRSINNLLRNHFLIILISVFTTALLACLIIKNATIGYVGLYSIDEYVFQGSIRHMVESFLTGNLSGIFGFGFYQYGFIYFLLNALAAAPGIITENYSWALIAPRVVTAFFAVGSLVFVYNFSRYFLSRAASTLVALFFVTMPAFWFNATWFHPDWPMTFFLLGFVLYLTKDNWQFGRNFKFGVTLYGLALAFKYQALTAMPLLVLYIFYDFLRHPLNSNLIVPTKRLVLSVASIIGIFTFTNPYILHPMGWTAFSIAFFANMRSNATNHGSSEVVSLAAKLSEAVGDYYLNIIFLFIALLGTLWLAWRYLKVNERNIFSLLAINFLINFGYLLFFVNKAWQMYYLPVFVVGLLSLIYFIKNYSPKKQSLVLLFVCTAQILIYYGSYVPVLEKSRDYKAPDYTTYTVEQNKKLDTFIINNLEGLVDSNTDVLITPYTPFSFTEVGLAYEQVQLIFGPLNRSSIDKDAYLVGQKNYWGDLKSDNELLSSFQRPDIIIIRKNIPFMTETDFSNYADKPAYEDASKLVSQLYNGDIGYKLLSENDLATIFISE